MSHDQGRPSLFAGMEDGADPGSDTQRVRILSTLESTRRSQRPARKGPSANRKSAGPSRLLIALMGLGAITLLAGFVLTVVNQKPPAAPRPEARLATVMPAAAPASSAVIPTVSASAPDAAVAVAPIGSASEPASAPVAADSTGVAANASTNGLNTPSGTTPAPRDPLAALATAALAAAPAPAPVAASHAPAPALVASTPVAKPRVQTARATAQPKPVRPSRNDRDVQLIEAVMSHASSRPATAPTRP